MTAFAVETLETLPTLQAEIEALHAELLGGEGITAAAVVTELSGPAETVTPDALRVLEGVLGGRFAEQMAKVWSGDYTDFDGDESDGEWALAKEAVYHALQLGYADDALALVVEHLMRAGPYRAKWDSPRTVTLPDKSTVRTTWLGMTIGRAIEARKRKPPEMVFQKDAAAAGTAPSETPDQIITRLERELAHERAAGAVRQTVIRALRAENEELKARFTGIVGVMENPQLRGNEKTIAIRLTSLTHSVLDRANQADGPPSARIDLGDLGRRAGVSKGAAGRALDLLSKSGGPFEKRCHVEMGPFTDPKTGELLRSPKTGEVIPCRNFLLVTPRAQTVAGTIAALQAFTPERESPNDWGGPRAPRCELHPDTQPIRRTTLLCGKPGCDRILDERDDRPKTQDALLVPAAPTVVVSSPLQEQDALLVPPIGMPAVNGQGNGKAHDSEASPFDQRAAALVATPLGGDRADRDYGRWAPTLEERVPRLQLRPKVDSNGHTEDLPPDLSTLAVLAERRGWAPLATRHGTVGGTEAAWRRFLSLPPPWLPGALPALLAGPEVAP